MKKLKVLVLGVKGMAGHVIFHYLKSIDKYQVYGIAKNIVNNAKTFNLDVSDEDRLKKILNENKFDFIINCIGILNNDAESNPSKAIWVNSYFPHFLEDITRESLSRIIHISTDCVFNGKKGNYSETDIKNGEGFYAQSKALGEIINTKDLTIRTSIIGPELNPNGIGLFNWFMHQKGEINGYTNVIWSGVTTLELAKAIHHAIHNSFSSGLVHLTNGVPISKFDLLHLFKDVFGKNEITIKVNNGKVFDKSLKKSERFGYKVPSYKKMLIDQYAFMQGFVNLYKY